MGVLTYMWTYRSFIILALIVGTIYLRLKPNTSTFFSRASVIFLYVFRPIPRWARPETDYMFC